jgi:GTPase SAR1 family protein
LISGTTSLVAPRDTFIVPYQKNDQFTGRHAFLDKLATKLWKNDSPNFSYQIVLHGLGGVGKTQIALQYAHIHRDKYGNVFWVSAVSEAAILAGFQDIGKQTGCIENIGKLEPTEITARVLTWLNAQKQWLLIFDNLEDDSVVKKFMPHPSSLKHMLMTTRNQHCDMSADKVEVAVLELDEARELLLTRSNTNDTIEAQDEATRIIKLLGNLPLAIEQAAAYIREVSKDIFKYSTSDGTRRRVRD